MKTQACEPCAKRKVRCDKGEPCSNCKRRKQDSCTYSEASPADRIRRLEAFVRNLGGDPDNPSVGMLSDAGSTDTVQSGLRHEPPVQFPTPSSRTATESHPATLPATPVTVTGNNVSVPSPQDVQRSGVRSYGEGTDPVISRDNGQLFYLESRAWHGGMNASRYEGINSEMATTSPFLTMDNPDAFSTLLSRRSSRQPYECYPSQHDHEILWQAFQVRVDPFVKTPFSWMLARLCSASIQPELRTRMTYAEHALMFSIYFISIVSLSDEECSQTLSQDKESGVAGYQVLCEEALCWTNWLCITDITVIKALTLYMMAGMDRLSIQSLWSLMGLVIRNAERLGIHRDGTLLGLSPSEVEERRRVWWQLQHVDLALAIKGGLTPLTLMADWDAKLPLNIEDDDMKMTATEMPKERKGLTSLSYCLYTYWVLNEQRRFFRDRQLRFRLSWQASTSLKQTDKDSLLDELETGIGQNFLQYCDPLRPIDVLIQFSAKALILIMRIRALHPLVYGDNSTQATQESRDELLELCVRCLEYNIATHLQPLLKNFQWWVKGMFSWLALMCVIVEVLQQQDEVRTERLWSLLADLYSANMTLSDLTRDRRKHHMAKLIVSAWKARQDRSNSGTSYATPVFITDLESRLSAFRAGNAQTHTDTTVQQQSNVQAFDPTLSDSYLASLETDAFDFDLQDIDWSYWSSIG